MSVLFAKSPAQVVLPNPSVPGRKHKGRLQVKNAATSGRIVVSDLGAGSETWCDCRKGTG